MTNIKSVQKKDLIVTHVLDAPVTRVWKACTEPELVKAMVGSERLHVACLQDKLPRRRRVMDDQITFKRWMFRIGGVALTIGALMGMVGNLIHPATPSGDPEGVARTIAESEIWILVHLVIVIGLIFMLGGLVAVYHSISGGLAGALVRLGFVAAIAGVTVGLITVMLDAIAASRSPQGF